MTIKSVDEFVGSLTQPQRDELNALPEPGERILWATRPKLVLWAAGQGGRISSRTESERLLAVEKAA